MKLLIMGGTSDGRKFCQALIDHKQHNPQWSLEIIYSIAGLVGKAQLDCEVISGGFSQSGGLVHFIKERQITALVDLTHPYAVRISDQAQRACSQLNIAYWQFLRPVWQEQPGDRWYCFEQWQDLLQKCRDYQRPLVTTGQLQQAQLDKIAAISERVCYRTAAPSQAVLKQNVDWLKAKGPFDLEQERALLKQLRADVLISKNAGGKATYAKLAAARELGIDVLMLERPQGSAERLAGVLPPLESIELLTELVLESIKLGQRCLKA